MALFKFMGLLFGAGLLCLIISCDIFQKTGLPEGHNTIIEGVYHGEEPNEPFDDGDEGCASSDCHQSDLKGGVAEIKGKKVVAPSCFQCHGKVWERKGRHERD